MKIFSAICLLVSLVLLAGCSKSSGTGKWVPTMANPPPLKLSYVGKDTPIQALKEDDVIVAVNGVALTKRDFLLSLERFRWILSRNSAVRGRDRETAISMYQEELIDRFVSRALLAQAGRDERLLSESDVRAKVDEAIDSFVKTHRIRKDRIDGSFPGGMDAIQRDAEESVWSTAYTDKHAIKGIEVTDGMVSNVFAEIATENAVIAASNATIRAKLEGIRNKIVSGAVTFEEMVEKYSEGSEVERAFNGVYGRNELRQFPEVDFFAVEDGYMSEILDDGVSYSIVKLIKHEYAERDKKGKLVKPERVQLAYIEFVHEELVVLAQSAEGVKKDLQAQSDAEALRQKVEQLKSAARVIYPHGTNFWQKAETSDGKKE